MVLGERSTFRVEDEVLKKLKKYNNDNDNNNSNDMGAAGEDRISELSDPLLLHILCFVPARCAASTSILSKRWRYVWTSFVPPILDFRGWRSHNVKVSLQTRWFMRFMGKLLSLHGGMPNIQEFYLDYDKNLNVSLVNAWISTLVQRKVEKLHLFIERRFRSFMLAPCLFTCESLTVLELQMDNLLKLPESISFPRLKILRLMYTNCGDGNLIQQFLSNSPLLEELIFTKCFWSKECMIISAPTLKHLAFRFDGKERDRILLPYAYLSKIRQEDRILAHCMVKIHAPSLLSLSYTDCVAMDYDLCSFASLADANIALLRPCASFERKQVMSDVANKFVLKLSNVKFLKMSSDTFELLSFADVVLTSFPTFHNLIHLEVTGRGSRFDSIIRIFFDFLQYTPNLESLVFAEDLCSVREDCFALDLVHPCLLLHLKTVEFRNLRVHHLIWVKLFLKNAGVLQRMTVIAPPYEWESWKINMELLLMFPRASTSCVVECFIQEKKN